MNYTSKRTEFLTLHGYFDTIGFQHRKKIAAKYMISYTLRLGVYLLDVII